MTETEKADMAGTALKGPLISIKNKWRALAFFILRVGLVALLTWIISTALHAYWIAMAGGYDQSAYVNSPLAMNGPYPRQAFIFWLCLNFLTAALIGYFLRAGLRKGFKSFLALPKRLTGLLAGHRSRPVLVLVVIVAIAQFLLPTFSSIWMGLLVALTFCFLGVSFLLPWFLTWISRIVGPGQSALRGIADGVFANSLRVACLAAACAVLLACILDVYGGRFAVAVLLIVWVVFGFVRPSGAVTLLLVWLGLDWVLVSFTGLEAWAHDGGRDEVGSWSEWIESEGADRVRDEAADISIPPTSGAPIGGAAGELAGAAESDEDTDDLTSLFDREVFGAESTDAGGGGEVGVSLADTSAEPESGAENAEAPDDPTLINRPLGEGGESPELADSPTLDLESEVPDDGEDDPNNRSA